MTALTAPRATPTLETGANFWRTFGVAADEVIYPGAMVALNGSGFLEEAAQDATLRCVGIAVPKRQQMSGGIVNATGLANGAAECEVQSCIALMANGSNSLTRADIGADCFILDDQTVVKTDGGVGQVTEATVVYSAGDATGFTITGVGPVITVNAATSGTATAVALAGVANGRADFAALYNATTDGAKIIVAKKTAGTFTLTKSVAGAADLTPITNTTVGVAVARSIAGKVWDVDARGVWVALGLP